MNRLIVALAVIFVAGCAELKNIKFPDVKDTPLATNSVPEITNSVPIVISEPVVKPVATQLYADAVSVKGLRPWGDDKVVSLLRSVVVRGDTIHLDFDKPPFPDRNENISITWVAIQIKDGKAVKMGRFEHGRPSNDTRDASTLISSRPGFTVNRGDPVAVMGIAYFSSERKKIRMNNVMVEWK